MQKFLYCPCFSVCLLVSRGILSPLDVVRVGSGQGILQRKTRQGFRLSPARGPKALARGITAVKQREICFKDMLEFLTRDSQHYLRGTEGMVVFPTQGMRMKPFRSSF